MVIVKLDDGTELRIDSLIVAQRLASAIKESGMSYAELEEKTGIPRSSLNRYANGKIDKIPFDRIGKIALATHTSYFYILGQIDSKEEESATHPDSFKVVNYDDEMTRLINEIKRDFMTLDMDERKLVLKSIETSLKLIKARR